MAPTTCHRQAFAILPCWLAWGLLLAGAAVHASDDCTHALFTCETNRAGKYVQICATEVTPGQKWQGIHYRFGAEGRAPEFVYPAPPADGAGLLRFSHTAAGSDYRVSIRFTSGNYTYNVYSYSGQGRAGVRVSDAQGRQLSDVRCIERPHMFPSYLRQALACDTDNPHGVAACGKDPLRVPAR